MKVGNYVRTRFGDVGKIIEKYKGIGGAIIYKIDKPTEDFDYTNAFNFEIIKSSPNIIDLIEEGDYINGYPVYEIVEYEDGHNTIVLENDNKQILWTDKDIKSIVTKEQFESMEYKVGD